MCIPNLVIVKYFRNNTIEIKRIVFTYPELLQSAHLVGQLLNSIHDARTYVYKKNSIGIYGWLVIEGGGGAQ